MIYYFFRFSILFLFFFFFRIKFLLVFFQRIDSSRLHNDGLFIISHSELDQFHAREREIKS